MKIIMIITLLTCVCLKGQTQVNFVKNPSLELYSVCPSKWNQINYCQDWSIPGDSTTTKEYCLEYYNACSGTNPDAGVPETYAGYQFPRTGNGMAGSTLYYDKTPPPPFGLVPFNYRDNLVGRLYKNLIHGKLYCVKLWVNMAERSGVAHNKIGAYLDDGTINIVDTLGEEISNIKPQIFTNEVIKDTLNWTKIEGSFLANGSEKYITIGNFFPNDSITTIVTNYRMVGTQYSYYLIDDVSVIPIDLDADAGKDTHAEPGKQVHIGRIGDTTVMGLDCKWYNKGALIDSGAVINVNGSTIVGTIDTYVVVQTICGLSKTDTVTVTTVPLGMKEWNENSPFTIYPNPSIGALTIKCTATAGMIQSNVYDFLGRMVHQQALIFENNTATLNLDLADGMYILELSDVEGNIQRERITIK